MKFGKTLRVSAFFLAVLFAFSLLCIGCEDKKALSDEEKCISILVYMDGMCINTTSYITTAATLGDALRELEMAEIKDGMVTSLCGIEVDSSKEQWWCLTKDGEMLFTGVNDTVLENGDQYEFTLTVGYDNF